MTMNQKAKSAILYITTITDLRKQACVGVELDRKELLS